MNIRELADQAGIDQYEFGYMDITKSELDKFALLVAAATRARCIELVLAGSSMPIQTRTLEALQRDRKQGAWGGGFKAKRAMAADKLQEPAQEPVAWMVYTQDGKSVYVTDNPTDIQEGQRALPIYTAPPQRERVVFPTMLRKMWSGGEVQAWLDENVNKEKTHE